MKSSDKEELVDLTNSLWPESCGISTTISTDIASPPMGGAKVKLNARIRLSYRMKVTDGSRSRLSNEKKIVHFYIISQCHGIQPVRPP